MEQALERALVALVRAVARRARAVALACALASVVLLGWALTHLGVNTHHTAILSDDMPFWRDYNEFAEVFPILDESLIVVIDAETVGAARDAAVLLAQRLEQQPERYHDVYVPGGDPFFEREALLYLEVDELEAMGDQLATVQPILAELVRDPSLGNLATVLRHGIEQAREHPETPVDLTRVFDSLGRAARAVLEGRGRPISWSEMILERKLPGDTARRVVLLEPVYHYERLLPGAEAIASVRETARELGLTPENGVQVRITGNVALSYGLVAAGRSVRAQGRNQSRL